MKSTFGRQLRITIWGGSHEESVGVKVKGLPFGTVIDRKKMQTFLNRRKPGSNPFVTERREQDIPVPLCGVKEEGNNWIVSDSLVSFALENTDRSAKEYETFRNIPRPGHADYTAGLRYGAQVNMAGGGPFSGRMTAPLCIAGGIALQILEKQGVTIGAHLLSVGEQKDIPFHPIDISCETLKKLTDMDFAVLSPEAGKAMQKDIVQARKQKDSLGGIIEVCALGISAGLGGAMYDGLESILAPIFFGIPAVKGVEFGAGFEGSQKHGSEQNDAFYYEDGVVKTKTNRHGGILGGITTGMPILARIAIKPTPSIGKEQVSVQLRQRKQTTIQVQGRHDPCIAVRAVPVVEAAMALGLLDCMLEREAKAVTVK